MTENKAKDQAERLRKAYRGQLPDTEIERVADELDPPRPTVMPGDPIVWRWKDVEMPYRHGIYEPGGYTRTPEGARIDLRSTDWKPARMLGPRQVAVELPPVSGWSDRVNTMQIQYVPRDAEGFPFGAVTVLEITRNQAERMEAEDE